MTDSTRIADLPTNETLSNQYIPMNVHPNPYGNTIGHPSPTPISSDTSFRTPENNIQHRLPSKDIPQDTAAIITDTEVKANYIPPTPRTKTNYIDHITDDDTTFVEYQETKRKDSFMKLVINQIQIPVITMILFFIFELSVFRKSMFFACSNLGMYTEEGNLNNFGSFTKSILFGLTVFFIQMFIEGLAKTLGTSF